jgi:type IV secretory pathway VirB3-like protein
LTYKYHFYAPNGYENAFLINFLMSLLFVQFFFLRSPGLLGLSYGAAWAKMIGTAMLAVVYALQRRQPMFRYSFMMFLYVSTFLYDWIYIALLAMARRASARASAAKTQSVLAA